MSNALYLLKSKRFLPLFITQFFGAFNDNAFKNAFLIWFTYDVAAGNGEDAQSMVALAAGLFILPFFLFSATAGQLVDKYEKAWLTRHIKLVEIVLMFSVALCFYLQSVNGLLFVLFCMGVQSAFFGPIKYSLLPEHLKEDELIRGNGLIEGGTFLSILLGTIFGGLIIRTEYGTEIISAFAIIFAIIGWLSSCKIPPAKVGDSHIKIGWNIASETWKIMGFARKEPTVWLSIIGISWFWYIGATFLTQFPVYTKDIIGGNEHIVTLFLTMFSVGIGIGSVGCGKLLRGKINGRLAPTGCISMTLSIFFFVIASHFYQIEHATYLANATMGEGALIGLGQYFAVGISSWLIMFSLLTLSISSGIYVVPLYAIMQHRSDAKFLARIIAANNVMNALFMVLASIIALVLFALHLNVMQLILATGFINIPAYFIVRGIVLRRLKHA